MTQKTIMVVDDSKFILKVVTDILSKGGYNVVIASDGLEALEKLKNMKVDLLLIDFFMPQMSGRELCEKIRADSNLKDVKLAFLTSAEFSPHGMKELENLNVLDYIKKSFVHNDLIQRVKKILNGKNG